VTNGSRAKVWDAAYEPFGRARVFTLTVEMNLRLPGQQLQAETGLHQNWMRDCGFRSTSASDSGMGVGQRFRSYA
jgi:hypothetical protein